MELHYPFGENTGADQLRGYREAHLRLCFRIYAKNRFSHNEAHMILKLLKFDCSLPDGLSDVHV